VPSALQKVSDLQITLPKIEPLEGTFLRSKKANVLDFQSTPDMIRKLSFQTEPISEGEEVICFGSIGSKEGRDEAGHLEAFEAQATLKMKAEGLKAGDIPGGRGRRGFLEFLTFFLLSDLDEGFKEFAILFLEGSGLLLKIFLKLGRFLESQSKEDKESGESSPPHRPVVLRQAFGFSRPSGTGYRF